MRIIRYAIYLLIGAAFGVIAATLTREAGPAAMVLCVLVAPFLATLVHEAGHLLTGFAAGMKPVFMIAGPLGFYWRQGQRPWLRLFPLPFGGFTLCVPPSGRNVRRPMIAMTAGGPLASLALAVAAAAFWFSTDDPLHGPVAFLGVISALFFAVTAIPYMQKGMSSDGAKIRMLMRNDANARALCAELGLLGAAWRGVLPARWPREQIETALAANPDSPEHISARQLAYYAALDAGDEAGAEDLIRTLVQAVEGMSEAIAGPVVWEAAAFALFARGDAEAARVLIEGRRPVMFQDAYLEQVVRAGLAAAQGNREQALILARKARASLGHALFPGWAALHGRWLTRLEAELAAPAAPRAGTAA